jgi:hypothetical protein
MPKKLIEYNGKKQCVKQWAAELGLTHSCLSRRLKKFGSPDVAFNRPQRLKTRGLIEFSGKKQTVSQWAKEIGVEDDTLYRRLRKYSVDKALTMGSTHVPAILAGEKYCKGCDRILPVSSYNNPVKRKKGNRKELPSLCKQCNYKQSKQYRQKRKMDCLHKYSNGTMKCAHCGYDDPRALVIDHINNDGGKERKSFKTDSNIYQTFRNEDRDDLQVLCFNCNWIKHVENLEKKALE